MNVSNLLTEVKPYDTSPKKEADKTKQEASKTVVSETEKKDSNTAAVYTPTSKSESTTDSTSKIYKPDTNLAAKLKADAEQRTQQLKNLVEKLLLKQGETYSDSMNIFQLLREGKVKVDPATAAEAKDSISEDGYWGVKQTSERIYSFAFALTGGDPSKADKMLAAVEKGFNEATKTWGDKLPDICQKTLDAVKEKFSEWKASASDSAQSQTE